MWFALVGVRLLVVALAVANRGENTDRLLALADTAAEFEPSTRNKDKGRYVEALEVETRTIRGRFAQKD